MAQLYFFAAHDDQVAIVNFLLSKTDVRIFEFSPPYGQEPKQFSSVRELEGAYSLGLDVYGNSFATLLSLWSPSVAPGEPTIVKTAVNPRKCNGHAFRYGVQVGFSMQLYFGGVYEKKGKVITRSCFQHVTKRRAEINGKSEGVQWENLKKLSNRIQYHIRSKLAVVHYFPPTLPEAMRLAQEGYALKETAGWPGQYTV